MNRKLLFGCWIFAVGLVSSAGGENWPNFRGPGGLGVSGDTGLPVTWNDTENIVWKTELPGPGASSPVTWGDRIYLTCYSGYGLSERDAGDQADLKRHLLCLNRADGKLVWEATVAAPAAVRFGGFQARHGYASSTPATDGERVYVFFEKEGVLAYDLAGKQLWQADVGQRTHSWGSGTSPVLYKNLVIVNAAVESESLVALDKSTGREAWRTGGIRQSWNTPLLVEVADGKQELVVSIQGSLLGFDPETGERLWNCPGIQDYVCPSVVAQDGVVYAIGGRRGTALAVKAGSRGEVEPLWTQQAGSNVSSPVVYRDHLFWISDQGIAYCLKAATGEIAYEQRIPGRRVEGYASALAADGKVYNVTRERGTFVLAARPQFEQLAHNELAPDTSICNASPAVTSGQLLLRSNRYVYCVGSK